MIQNGKGLELNTSSRRYGLTELTPSAEILKLYRNLGGRILTIGSDSHRREHLAAWLLESQEALRELGFGEVYTFRQMQPIAHKL